MSEQSTSMRDSHGKQSLWASRRASHPAEPSCEVTDSTAEGERTIQGGQSSFEHRWPLLDGLRGIAVLLVMMAHSFAGIRTAHIGRAFSMGWAGVDLFFVLSGFLITRSLLITRSAPDRFKNFYLKRALRIWPLYFFVLGVAFVAGPYFAGPQQYDVRLASWWTYPLFVQNLQFAHTGVAEPWPLAITWSLAIEEQFYLLWPLLVFSLSSRQLKRVLVLIIVASPLIRAAAFASGATAAWAYYATPARLDGLAVGALISLWLGGRSEIPGKHLRWARGLLWCLLVSYGACVVWLHGENGVLAFATPRYLAAISLIYSGVAVGFGGLVVIALAPRAGPLEMCLRSSALRWIGKVSFALYLFHYPVFEVARVSLSPRLVQWAGLPTALSTALAMGSAYLLSFGLAWASWRWLEAPFLRLKERV